MDRQCSSCGGFCKKSGCERENVKPKEWVGLTDDEIRQLEVMEDEEERKGWCDPKLLIAWTEAKLRRKNT